MELSRKNLRLKTTTDTSRERLNPISSSSFYSTTTNTKHNQDYSTPRFENSTASSFNMTDLGHASDAGHETSASPPPAKRTRLNVKGKTPTPSVSASPPANRINTRRSAAAASSASTSVAGDVHVYAPQIMADVDSAPSAQDSRASSVMSTSAHNTRSRKRKADQIDSETPSVIGEPVTQASSVQDDNADGDAAEASPVKLDTPHETNPEDQDPDQDQEEDQNEDDEEEEEEVAVKARGRPPGKGRGGGRGRGRGGRGGGRGRGKGKGKSSRQDSGAPEGVKKSSGRGGRGRKTSDNHLVQVAYDRQADLKQNYKEIVRMVRAGLAVLAEKSLAAVQEDPTRHMRVPEFKTVMDELDATRNNVITQQQKKFDMKVAHAKKEILMNEEATNLQFEHNLQILKDKYLARCKAAFLDTLRLSAPANDQSASVVPDERASYRFLPEETIDLAGGEANADDLLESGARRNRRATRGSSKKRAGKEPASGGRAVKRPSLLSAAARPAEGPDDGQEPPEAVLESLLENQVLETQPKEANDPSQPVVSFLRRTRRGQPTVFRTVVKPYFAFDPDEIGFRNSEGEAEGQPPQPKNLYIDTVSFEFNDGDGYDLSEQKVGDFDMNLVRRHGLHPQYGLAIPGCRNPDDVVPRTDFTKPVPRTTPITFATKDGKEIFPTSRSAATIHAHEDFDQFAHVSDMRKAIGKFDPREMFTPAGLATFDAVAREVGITRQGAEELLQAASEIELEERNARPVKRQKISAGSTPATTGQVLGIFNDVQEIEREAFMRRSYPSQGAPAGLDVLADMAERVSRETARRSPAPAQFVNESSIQNGTGFRSNYSPPKRTYNQAFSQMQSSEQKAKYSDAPKHASPQALQAPATKPLPKRREPPLPVETASLPQMNPEPVAPRLRASQSMGAQSMGDQPMVAQSMGSQSMGSQSMGSQYMGSQSMGSQYMGSQSMGSQSMGSQSMGSQSMGSQSMRSQSMGSQSTGPQLLVRPTFVTEYIKPPPREPATASTRPHHHSMARPRKGPQPMLPPDVMSQTAAGPSRVSQLGTSQHAPTNSRAAQQVSQQMSTHHSLAVQQAPNQMAPTAVPNQPTGSYQMVPQLMSPRNMGPPPSLPPTMSPPTMGPPKASPQTMGPPPTLPNPSQPTFTRPRNMTGGQTVLPIPNPSQMPSSQMHSPQPLSQAQSYFQGLQNPQQVHQQHIQQPPPQPPQPPQRLQQQQQQQSTPPTSRSNRSAPSLPTLAPRPDRGRSNSRQVQRHHYENAATMPSYEGPSAAPPPERIYNYATRDTYAQQQGQQQAPQNQQQSYVQAQTQPPQYQAQQQQVQPLPQAQQYHVPVQQRQPQSPVQQFQHAPQQRQAQSSGPQYQQQQAHQIQPPQTSPGQSFQQPAQQPPQSPAAQPQQPEQHRQHRESFGGGDGAEEREHYTSPVSQFRPINKQYPSHPQQQRFQQHRSPYSNPPQRASHQSPQQAAQQHIQHPGQQPPTQQQPSFSALPPPPPPPSGRRGMGSYGGYPEL